MQKTDTKYKLKNTLASAISEWFKTGYISQKNYPEKYHDIIWS